MSKTPLSYAQAGVNIDAGNALITRIKAITKRTHRSEVMGGLGGFGALFALPLKRYKKPILVSSTDGVGTKLKLAIASNRHTTIGIDLVAMCVNDIIVSGAEPLFFLDYFATGQLDVDKAETIIAGIGRGCELAGAALIGGETAEMPGMYAKADYDLAGFAVGIVEADAMIDFQQVAPGDVMLGLPSSGPHANGYSLIRKIIDVQNLDLQASLAGESLIDHLMRPTIIYVKAILALQQAARIKAIAHITGGGFLENIPRVLPEHCQARIYKKSWQIPPIFQWIQEHGQISDTEMLRTFNCGVGMVVTVAPEAVEASIALLKQQGHAAFILGEIGQRQAAAPAVSIV